MKHPNARIEAFLVSLASPQLSTIDLSLERVNALLSALGNPQNHLPPIVHVAGTNGKGSLVAYLTSILQSAGYRVHRYTSPYLVRVNENIVLAGKEINDAFLLEILGRVSVQSKKHPVTYFEAITAAAFLAFNETPADIVLLETGLGGRLDATNTVIKPAVTAITPISEDHKEYLGGTIEQIAGEKAGIIKQGVPCVVGPQSHEAFIIIERASKEKSAPLYRNGQQWQVSLEKNGFTFTSQKRTGNFPLPNLVGKHQAYNAATAIAVLDCLADYNIEHAHIAEGITHAVWPARLQRLNEGKLFSLLPPNGELWLDGGHNPEAGKVLAEWAQDQKKPIHLICGMLKNKDIEEFLRPLASYTKSLIAVSIQGQPMSQSPSVITDIGSRLGIEASHAANIDGAIKHIVNNEKNGFIILICGSLYLAGNILWQNSK